MINSLIKRASVYHQLEQVEKSFENFKLAEKIDPNSSEIYHHRAQVIIIIIKNYIAINKFGNLHDYLLFIYFLDLFTRNE